MDRVNRLPFSALSLERDVAFLLKCSKSWVGSMGSIGFVLLSNVS
jgi:hypothetical protein